MTTVFVGGVPPELETWLKDRQAKDLDGYDEVWEGSYHVPPMARPQQGDIQQQLAVLLYPAVKRAGLWGSGPVNLGVADNFRVPDWLAFRERATTLYVPTAAIVAEVISPGDESYRKFGFYFARGVEEILIVDPGEHLVAWFHRGPEDFLPSAHSALLGVSAADLAAQIDWPPPPPECQ